MSENSATTRPIWIHPDLADKAGRPRRKIHLDYHNSQYVPSVGEDFEPDEFVATLKAASIDSIVVFAKDMHGYFYYPSEYGPVHPGLGGRFLTSVDFYAIAIIFLVGPVLTRWLNRDIHFRKLGGQPGAVSGPDGVVDRFEIDPFRKECLLAGVDDISFTLNHSGHIAEFENAYEAEIRWL